MANIDGLSLRFTQTSDGKRDVWLNFVSVDDGKSCSLSIAAIADRSGSIVGAALRGWASDRINDHLARKIAAEEAAQQIADNGQFGVGS